MSTPSQPKNQIFDQEVAPRKADQTDRIFMVGALRPGVSLRLDEIALAFTQARGRA
ncbi:hypothetical protein U8L64_00035 [Pseudomonas sp. FIP_A4]|uniref:hypothetical protein n=1 Tax=Pseudomonas sp. FIP_A4 TaxID=3070684 RepID=UPI002FD604CE